MKMKGKALLAGYFALAMNNVAFDKDIKVSVVGAMSGPVRSTPIRNLLVLSKLWPISTSKAA